MGAGIKLSIGESAVRDGIKSGDSGAPKIAPEIQPFARPMYIGDRVSLLSGVRSLDLPHRDSFAEGSGVRDYSRSEADVCVAGLSRDLPVDTFVQVDAQSAQSSSTVTAPRPLPSIFDPLAMFRYFMDRGEGAEGTGLRVTSAAPLELGFYTQIASARELKQRVFAVHAMNKLPRNGVIDRVPSDVSPDVAPNFYSGSTLAWTLGGMPPVPSVSRTTRYGTYNIADPTVFAVVTPLGSLSSRWVSLSPQESLTAGNRIDIPSQAVLLVPRGTAAPKGNKFKVVEYDGDLKSAVERYIKENGGLSIEAKQNQGVQDTVIHVDGKAVHPQEFLGPLFLENPRLSYGYQLHNIHGEAFRFVMAEFLIKDTINAFGERGLRIGTPELKIRRRLIAAQLIKIKGWALDTRLPSELRKSHQRAYEDLRGWLNIIDVDIRLRDQYYETLDLIPRSTREIFALRADFNKAWERAVEVKFDMEAMDERLSHNKVPDEMNPIDLQALSNAMVSVPPREFTKFLSETPELSKTEKLVLTLHYGLRRWVMIKEEAASKEGLDILLGNALSQMPENTPQDGILFSFFRKYQNLGDATSQAAQALEQQPFIQDYLIRARLEHEIIVERKPQSDDDHPGLN